jgi:hypothetical protein
MKESSSGLVKLKGGKLLVKKVCSYCEGSLNPSKDLRGARVSHCCCEKCFIDRMLKEGHSVESIAQDVVALFRGNPRSNTEVSVR